MKKIMLIFVILLCVTACTDINSLSIDSVISKTMSVNFKPNVYKTGYKYYLPRGMSLDKSYLFNEIISSKNYLYYLYVDVVSYYNKSKKVYKFNKNAYFSKIYDSDNGGYLEINLKGNGQYLIEIIYNYAKIEVIVDKKDINECVSNALYIVKSIKYNNDIIASLLEKKDIDSIEEEFNVFNTTKNDSTYMKIDDTYKEPIDDNTVPDTDLIK